MRIRHLATSAALGAVLAFLVPALAAPALAAEPCPAGQPPGRTPGRNASQGQPSTGRPSGYPLGQCQLQLSQSAGAAGARVAVNGDGFAPGSTVRLTAASVGLATAVADSRGAVATTFVVPAALPIGDTTITASGVNPAGEVRELAADFTVLAASTSRAAARRGDLPRTGSDVTGPLIAVGAGLVFIGAVAVVGARRRRRAAAV
jgi:LPXTG-motif cell wall-anchored protein